MALEVIGTERLQAAFVALGALGPRELGAGLYQEAEAIMTTAKEDYVPVDQGTLRASGFVREVTPLEVELGFGGPAAPYALAVHENPRSGKTGGISPRGKHYTHWAQVGEWKYLETPFKAATAGMDGRLAERLEDAVTALGRS